MNTPSPTHFKVLHVIPTLRTGGAERLVADLLSAASTFSKNYALLTLYQPEGTPLEAKLREKGVPIYALTKRPGLDLRLIPQIRRALTHINPNVLHTHLYAFRYCLLPARLCRISVHVHTLHTLATHEDLRVFRNLYAFAFRHALAHPVAVSPAVARSALATYGSLPQLSQIPNGIALDDYTSITRTCSSRPSRIVLLNVARLEPVKNHLFLLEIAKFLHPLLPSFELWIAGDGPLRKSLEKVLRFTNLANHIKLLGNVADLRVLYASAQIFLLPSLREGLPMALLEAMAAGLPVIASPVGGVPDVISHGKNGILLQPEDPASWARTVYHLALDGDRRLSLGLAARETVVQRFNIQHTLQQYHALYIRLLEAVSRPSA